MLQIVWSLRSRYEEKIQRGAMDLRLERTRTDLEFVRFGLNLIRTNQRIHRLVMAGQVDLLWF